MIYLIALIVLFLIVILFVLFYSPKKAPQRRRSVAPVVQEQELVPGEFTEISSGAAVEQELELTLEESEFGAHEEELTLEKPEEPAHEEELTLEVPDFGAPAGEIPSAEGPVASLSAEAPAGDVAGPVAALADEEIPFIIEEEGEVRPHGEGEVAPALVGFGDESAALHEETPSDLAERLDFFFGSDEDTGEGPGAEEPVAEEAAILEAAPAEEVAAEKAEAEAVAVAEKPLALSSEEYEAHLRQVEDRLRQELDRALNARETGKLALLENELTAVCAWIAGMPGSLEKHNLLLEDFGRLLDEISDALPGFQGEAVRRNLRQGEAEVAQSLLAEAVQQLPEGSPLADRIRFLCGRLAEEQGEFSAAGEMYRQASAGEKPEPGALYAAGRMARILGNDEEARQRLEMLLGSGDNGDDSILLNLARHELARVYVRGEEKDKAQPLLQEALAGLEQQLGPSHPSLGPVLHDLAAFYESLGQYEQATPMYQRAMAVCEQGLGPAHPQLAATLGKLAGLYEELEEEGQAEPLYEKALAIKKQVVGPRHPDIGILLNHLANLLKQRGEYAKAEPMFLDSLEIAETALGKDHPNLTVILNNLAELYSETGDEEKAQKYEERAFALFELPGAGGDFVEMEKEEVDVDIDKDKTITGG